MDRGYFDDNIIKTIESAGCQYLIIAKHAGRGWKEYPTLASQGAAPFSSFIEGAEGRETTELLTLPACNTRNWTPGTRIEDLSEFGIGITKNDVK